jgi:hypothetical protein
MIAVLALSLLLQQPTADSAVYARFSAVGDQTWTSSVTQADIDDSPKWSFVTTDAPPLTPGDAIRAAWKVMEKLTLQSATEKWHLGADGVSLRPASHGWIYIVNFDDWPTTCTSPSDSQYQACGGTIGDSGGMHIIVLLSGRAIVPVRKGDLRVPEIK